MTTAPIISFCTPHTVITAARVTAPISYVPRVAVLGW